MKYGYARVSTAEQNESRQVEALRVAGIEVENIYIDKISGVKKSRPALNKLLKKVEVGDSITVLSFDRLARSTKQLLELSELLESREVDLISIKEKLDTSTPQGKLFFTISSAFAEFERSVIKERQAEGIALAKKAGKYKGREGRELSDSEKVAIKDMNSTEAMKYLGIPKTSYYRMRRQGKLA